MGRPKTKEDLISSAITSYKKLYDYINGMNENVLKIKFDFSTLNKKEAHWQRDKNLRDVLIHLYEWQKLIINWVDNNMNGQETPFLPDGYNWSNYGEMNIKFYEKHQNTSLEEAKILLESTHKKVLELINQFTTEQLFNKNVYKWVGGSTLGQYFISTTVAHYEWALNKLKIHSKLCSNI